MKERPKEICVIILTSDEFYPVYSTQVRATNMVTGKDAENDLENILSVSVKWHNRPQTSNNLTKIDCMKDCMKKASTSVQKSEAVQLNPT